MNRTPPIRIAHRGMPRRALENTIASFGLALEAGADGIELDVHATRDSIVVVHHDFVLSNGDEIAGLTYAEMSARQARSQYFIPTLGEVCAFVSGRADLFVEIKGRGIERLVAESLASYPGTAAVHSFDHDTIRRLAQSRFPRRLGVLIEDDRDNISAIMSHCGALDVWPEKSLVTRRVVAEVHALSGRVIPWTVNDPSLACRLAEDGVDGICSDDVTLLPVSSI